MPPVAVKPCGWVWGETANYCDQEILKIPPLWRGRAAKALYGMKNGPDARGGEEAPTQNTTLGLPAWKSVVRLS